MKKLTQHKVALSVVAVVLFGFLMTAPAFAQIETPDDPLGVTSFDNQSNLGSRPLEQTIGGIINVGLSLLGIVAVVIILLGGAKWMTSGGSEDKVAEARKLIMEGVIGLAVILSAWAIARFVLTRLAAQTGVSGGSNYTDTVN